VVKDINIPRLPTLKGKLVAKKIEIPTLTHKDIGTDPERIGYNGSATWVIKVFSPEVSKDSKIYKDNLTEGIREVSKVMNDIIEKL
jgi:electron transfer flavoprotein beta subunit